MYLCSDLLSKRRGTAKHRKPAFPRPARGADLVARAQRRASGYRAHGRGSAKRRMPFILDEVCLAIHEACLDAERELQQLPRSIPGIELSIGGTEGPRCARLDELLHEADLPARVLLTIMGQRLEIGLAVVGRAVAGHARSLPLNGKWQDISARGARNLRQAIKKTKRPGTRLPSAAGTPQRHGRAKQ